MLSFGWWSPPTRHLLPVVNDTPVHVWSDWMSWTFNRPSASVSARSISLHVHFPDRTPCDVVSVSTSRSRDGLETYQRLVSVSAIHVSSSRRYFAQILQVTLRKWAKSAVAIIAVLTRIGNRSMYYLLRCVAVPHGTLRRFRRNIPICRITPQKFVHTRCVSLRCGGDAVIKYVE